MIEQFKIDKSKVIQPVVIILRDSESQPLKIEVYKDQIIISTKHDSWYIVDESKKNFEKIINPYNKLWKYTKSILKYFFESMSKLF